jgi:hypothetical protein
VKRYDKDNLPTGDWVEYRKLGTTRMARVSGPFIVTTKEGEYEVPAGWQGFIALDSDGDPYPVLFDVHARAYERAEVTV